MRPNSYSGKFIVLEGSEGGGKSTQARFLFERMRKIHSTHLRKEPTSDNIFGRLVQFIYKCRSLHEDLPGELAECIAGEDYALIREMSADAKLRHIEEFETLARGIKAGDLSSLPVLIQLGMTFDGHEHLKKTILPALERGEHIVSDRWRFSTPAYAAADLPDWKKYWELQETLLGEEFVMPDIVFYFDVPVEIGIARTLEKQKGKKEYFDEPERMTKIKAAYEELLRDEKINGITKIEKVDGTRPIEEIQESIWAVVDPLIKKKR